MVTNMSAINASDANTSTWTIDPVHTVVEFKVKHMMISNVKGQFSKVTGALTLDEAALENSHVEGSIDAASLETRDAQRDAHLKERRLLRCREVSCVVVQVHQNQSHPGRRAGHRG
jgi:polyisoprenoid-binding protein YceI